MPLPPPKALPASRARAAAIRFRGRDSHEQQCSTFNGSREGCVERENYVWTLAHIGASTAAMDDETLYVTRELCRRAGTLMEDASNTALVWSGGDNVQDRLANLALAARQIAALFAPQKR